MALHPADFAHAQRGVDPRHIVARLAEHHGDPRPRIGRATHDLLAALIGLHRADTQAVRIRMLLMVRHLRERKRLEPLGRVLNPFHLKPKVRERFANLLNAGLRVEMVFQPRECEFHRLSPP